MLDRQRLTQENIEYIKEIKRFGYILSAMVIAFGLLGNIALFIEKVSYNYFIIYNISVFLLSIIVLLFVNRKYDNDLLYNEKDITREIIKNKRAEWQGGTCRRYIQIKNIEHSIFEEKFYNQIEIGDEVELHYALCSKMLLEITKKINH